MGGTTISRRRTADAVLNEAGTLERESLEFRLNEELEKSDRLTARVTELEQQLLRNSDPGYAVEETEKLEKALSEEREQLRKQRESAAFERESLEMQLNEELGKCDRLTAQVVELEKIVQSHRISDAGNLAELEALTSRHERQKSELERQLSEKD